MRTTLTLDDDLAGKLQAEARKSGEPFKQTVNRVLRLGLKTQTQAKALPPFKVRTRDLGLRPGFDFDNIEELLEKVDWQILRELITKGQAHGPLITDAHLAALAIEHGATLATTDRDFTRFPGLRILNPLA